MEPPPEWDFDQVTLETGHLLRQALQRGWTTRLIARAFAARYHATGVQPEPRIMLEAILDGEYDFLFSITGKA